MRYLFALLTLGLLLFSKSIGACSCTPHEVDLPIKEIGLGLNQADYRTNNCKLIFEGKLIRRTKGSGRRALGDWLVFAVTDVYKGRCVDTVRVFTPRLSASCGFLANVGSSSIIFTEVDKTGCYYTARGDCWRGVNNGYEPFRYQKFRDFLISIVYKVDGSYCFKQKQVFWPLKRNQYGEVANIEYTIRNGRLHGPWVLTNRRGQVVEAGNYRNGKRTGSWLYRVVEKNEFGYRENDYLKRIEF